MAGPYAGEYRIQTAHNTIGVLGRLAAGVADGWVPIAVVDLRSGHGWRAVLHCSAGRLLDW